MMNVCHFKFLNHFRSILLSFATFFFFSFSVKSAENYTPYIKDNEEINTELHTIKKIPKTIKRKRGGIAGAGAISGVAGFRQGELDLPTVDTIDPNKAESVDEAFLKEVLTNMSKAVEERVDLKENARTKYLHEINKFLRGERKVLYVDKLYVSDETSFYPVYAGTTNAGNAGGDGTTPIYVTSLTTDVNILDFTSESEKEKISLEQRIESTFGSKENYLKYKLFRSIFHELTHEIIPDDLFSQEEGHNSSGEETFVIEFTKRFMSNQSLLNEERDESWMYISWYSQVFIDKEKVHEPIEYRETSLNLFEDSAMRSVVHVLKGKEPLKYPEMNFNYRKMKFKTIRAGTFFMGTCPQTNLDLKMPGCTHRKRAEFGRDSNEGYGGRRQIQLTHSYRVQETETTQAQWYSVMGNNPSKFKSKGDCPKQYKKLEDGTELCRDHPVDSISWYEAVVFVNQLSRKKGLPRCYKVKIHNNIKIRMGYTSFDSTVDISPNVRLGEKINDCKGYRLLTEAEWENAARAGTETPFHFGEKITPKKVNYQNGFGQTFLFGETNEAKRFHPRNHPVGVASLSNRNRFGLYDMHGNVSEWVHDVFNFYKSSNSGVIRNPTGGNQVTSPHSHNKHILRGGSWFRGSGDARSAARHETDPTYNFYDIGFRIGITAR